MTGIYKEKNTHLNSPWHTQLETPYTKIEETKPETALQMRHRELPKVTRVRCQYTIYLNFYHHEKITEPEDI